jgi:hypothetical protein
MDGLRAAPDTSIRSIRSMRKEGVYRAGYLGGLLLAAMVERSGSVSNELFMACAIYAAAIGPEENLDRLERDPSGLVEAHVLAVAEVEEHELGFTATEDRFVLDWVAARAGVELGPELAARREYLGQMATANRHSRGLREALERDGGLLSPDLNRACLDYDIGLRSDEVQRLLDTPTPTGLREAHRLAWKHVEAHRWTVSPEHKDAVFRWLVSKYEVADDPEAKADA